MSKFSNRVKYNYRRSNTIYAFLSPEIFEKAQTDIDEHKIQTEEAKK